MNEVHSISPIQGFLYRNSIKDFRLNYNVTRVVNADSKFLSGIESTDTLMEPGKLTPEDHFGNVTPQDMQDQRSLETALYFQWDKDISSKWSLSAGLRFSYFIRVGKENIYLFDYDRMEGR